MISQFRSIFLIALVLLIELVLANCGIGYNKTHCKSLDPEWQCGWNQTGSYCFPCDTVTDPSVCDGSTLRNCYWNGESCRYKGSSCSSRVAKSECRETPFKDADCVWVSISSYKACLACDDFNELSGSGGLFACPADCIQTPEGVCTSPSSSMAPSLPSRDDPPKPDGDGNGDGDKTVVVIVVVVVGVVVVALGVIVAAMIVRKHGRQEPAFEPYTGDRERPVEMAAATPAQCSVQFSTIGKSHLGTFGSTQSRDTVATSALKVSAVGPVTVEMIEKSVKGKLIGRGASGCVFSAMLPSGKMIAVKEIYVPDESTNMHLDQIQREIDLLRELHHPHVVSYYGSQYVDDLRQFNIFMELMPSGSLSSVIKQQKEPLADAIAKRFVWQMVSSLAYVHSKGIVHRDIKCENFLLHSEGVIKLADFGVARSNISTTHGAQTIVGTPFFMAPETLNCSDDDGTTYSQKADV